MPRRIRVLQCVSHLALGGAERVAIDIAGGLRDEFDFGVCAIRGLADGRVGLALRQELGRMHAPVFTGPRVGMRHGGMLTGAFALWRAIRAFRPDIVHLHAEIPEACAATLLTVWPPTRRLPMIRTVHNSRYWHFAPKLGRWCDRRLGPAQIAAVSKACLAASLQLRRDSKVDDPSLGARVVYAAVPPVPMPPARARDPAGPIRVVFGGRFEEQKGTDLLPHVLADARPPSGRVAELTLFGSGRHQSLLDALARQPPPGWRVTVAPPVADFRTRLPEFDLVIIPSRFEGLCLVAIEAFLAGVAVVGTNAPGLSEAMPPDYPWLARADDAGSFATALEDALASRERWSEAVALGQAHAQHRFSPASMAAGYRRLYRAMVGLPLESDEAVPANPSGLSAAP